MTDITLNIQLAEPILLELAVDDGIQINTVKAGPPGANGLSVELQSTVDYIQWRYVGQTEWTNLIALADLIGPSGEDGREVELQVTSTHIQWRYTGDVAWTNLVALSVITGPPGIPGEDAVNIELQKSATHIQWRYIGDVTWNDLVALSEITGDDGTPGAPGAPGTPVELQLGATHIQWRYVGDAVWIDLIAIVDLMAEVSAHELAYNHSLLHAPGSDNQDLSGYEILANKVTDFQVTPDDTHYPSEKLVKDSLDNKQNTLTVNPDVVSEDLQDPTGFVDGNNIVVSYDAGAKTITLTHASGHIYYYWHGVRYDLGSPWVSDAHDDTTDALYLYSTDGVTFEWNIAAWELNYLQVAARVSGGLFGLREAHGLIPWQVHELWHRLLGTFRKSGGGLVAGTFALNDDSDAACTPSLGACTIADEDLESLIPLWPEGTYTHLWFTAAGSRNFNTVRTTIVYAEGGYAFVNSWNGSVFAWAATVANRYLNYYVIRIPVTADAESQKYRCVVLQPQTAYTSLAAAQAEEFRSIYLGDFASLTPEYIAVERMTFSTANANATTGKVKMVAHVILTGSKSSQTSVAGISPTTAENVSLAPSGDIAAINVQAGIEELDAEKVSEIIATQDPEYPISYLSYRRNGVQIDITEIPKADGMIKGCMVSYISGLRFGVSAGAYYMTGTLNRVDSDTRTLADAHPTLPRIDLIAVDNTPAIIVIQGTPAANPQKPSIDPETQIERTNILVPAGATEPGNIITDEIIYDEGEAGEFTLASAGVTVDGAYATDKFRGTYSINVTSLTTGATITLTSGTVLDRTDYENFVLYLKLKAKMANQQWLYVGFLNGGVLVTNEIRVPLTKNNTTSWQVVIMPLTGLTWSQAEFDAVRIRWSGASHAGMLLDYIKLETGVIQVEYNDSVTLTGDVQGTGVTGSPILTTMAGQYERLTGAKESVSDEGIAGQESWDDDYLYKCVVSGAAGFAIWKKIPMLKTREPR